MTSRASRPCPSQNRRPPPIAPSVGQDLPARMPQQVRSTRCSSPNNVPRPPRPRPLTAVPWLARDGRHKLMQHKRQCRSELKTLISSRFPTEVLWSDVGWIAGFHCVKAHSFAEQKETFRRRGQVLAAEHRRTGLLPEPAVDVTRECCRGFRVGTRVRVPGWPSNWALHRNCPSFP